MKKPKSNQKKLTKTELNQKLKPRNPVILAAIRGEVQMNKSVQRDKKKYTRKTNKKVEKADLLSSS